MALKRTFSMPTHTKEQLQMQISTPEFINKTMLLYSYMQSRIINQSR